jgi:hypothetical protein
MSTMRDRRETSHFQGIPGQWYVSFPSIDHPGDQPEGGPFATEPQAREWLKCVLNVHHRGGIVWQCPPVPLERKG